MAPVAVSDQSTATETKTTVQKPAATAKALINPFYSPPTGDDGDESYVHANYKVSR